MYRPRLILALIFCLICAITIPATAADDTQPVSLGYFSLGDKRLTTKLLSAFQQHSQSVQLDAGSLPALLAGFSLTTDAISLERELFLDSMGRLDSGTFESLDKADSREIILHCDFSGETLDRMLNRLRNLDMDIRQRAFLEEYLAPTLGIYRQFHASLRRSTDGVQLHAEASGPSYADVRRSTLALKSTDVTSRLPGQPALLYYDLERHDATLRSLVDPLFSNRPDLAALLAPLMGNKPDPASIFIRAAGPEWLMALYPATSGGGWPNLVLMLSLGEEGSVRQAAEALTTLQKSTGIVLQSDGDRQFMKLPLTATTEITLALARHGSFLVLTAGDESSFSFTGSPESARKLVRPLAEIHFDVAELYRLVEGLLQLGLPLPPDTSHVLTQLKTMLPGGVFDLLIASTPDSMSIDLKFVRKGKDHE